jgi:hypothetical protein
MATRFIKSAAQLNAEELLSRSTPEAKLAAEAALSFSKPPAAIVQEAKKDCASYEAEFKQIKGRHKREESEFLKRYKESGIWKEKYKTWDEACEIGLGILRRTANRNIADVSGQNDPPAEMLPPAGHITRVKSTASTLEEGDEEEEAPRVHSADEERPRKPINENGKPKQLMLVWGEIEQSVGRAINRCDELNRVCPNAMLHALFLAQSKACMKTLEEWKDSVK